MKKIGNLIQIDESDSKKEKLPQRRMSTLNEIGID
jgi:hypothetical protein